MLTAGLLGPGEMIEVDFSKARVAYNDELRGSMAKLKPFRDWIAEETLTLDDITPAHNRAARRRAVRGGVRLMTVDAAKLGHHWDDIDEVVRPMAITAESLSPPWASTRRSPASPPRPARSLTTSTSCSPR